PAPPTAVSPPADRPPEVPSWLPWAPPPSAPLPPTLPPCWLHPPPLRVNTQAAPAPPLSFGPPTMAVLPSADSATEVPWLASPTAPVPASAPPCWVHTPPLRVNTSASPEPDGAPTIAVLPSADNATDRPWRSLKTEPVPTNLLPCWLHTPPLRVKTHAAPVLEKSPGPPRMAVLPSRETATERRCWTVAPTPPVPTSLGPSCVKSASAGCAGQMSAADKKAGRKRRAAFLTTNPERATAPTSKDMRANEVRRRRRAAAGKLNCLSHTRPHSPKLTGDRSTAIGGIVRAS